MGRKPKYSREKGLEEHILSLPDGRQLTYAHNGPPKSRIVVLSFNSYGCVGSVPIVPKPCRKLGVHWIEPTNQGMGNSTMRNRPEPYHVALARDMTALLSHLYPTDAFDTLYIQGFSYGTVLAQMIYGAPYELFPPGRKIAGCILLGARSPLKYHKDCTRKLSWPRRILRGPVVRLQIRENLFRCITARTFETVESTKVFLQRFYEKDAGFEPKIEFLRWLSTNGMTKNAWIEQRAKEMVKSFQNWDGFMEHEDVVRSDWGFEPATLDRQHASKPMLVVGQRGEALIQRIYHDWLVKNYRLARFRTISPGSLAYLAYMGEVWGELLSCDASKYVVESTRWV